MRKRAIIIAGFILGCLLPATGLLAPSFAEQPSRLNMSAETTVSTGSASASVGMNANFTQGAAVEAHYEPMDVEKAKAQLEVAEAVKRDLHLKITGLPGETAYFTCNVTAAGSQRDCGSLEQVKLHTIKANEKYDNGILLTPDLMPNPTGKSESSVNIEVSYL